MEEQNIAIIGLGLLGTSLALALKDDKQYNVLGWTRRKDVRDTLLSRGTIAATHDDVRNIIGNADVSIICLPVPTIVSFCLENAPYFKSGSTVSDVGSVKETILTQVETPLLEHGVNFVGGHPMAGTEQTGPDAGFAELFQQATVFLTPTDNTNAAAKQAVAKVWEAAGANVHDIEAHEHDRIMAETSHISHVLAWLLVEHGLTGEDAEKTHARRLACSSAFRDVTRVASSSPLMWRQIIAGNRTAVLNALERFQGELQGITEIIRSESDDDLQDYFTDGKAKRDSWLAERWPGNR